MQYLEALEPSAVFKFFHRICQFPRGTGDEKALSDDIRDFAKERGLWVYQDELYNLIIKKPGTAGYEESEPLIVQGHLDMINIKDTDVVHDFQKDPIQIMIQGDLLTADGTTLGADNGIAVAMAMALMEDTILCHPPLEFVLTVREEIGMVGAKALDISYLKGRKFLNLDSSQEGVFIASSSGGLSHIISYPIKYKPIKGPFDVVKISVDKLTGGHSGHEIHLGRANAGKVLARILYKVIQSYDIHLVDIEIGTKRSVIPEKGYCVIAFHEENKVEVSNIIQEMEKSLKKEYSETDPGFTMMTKRSKEYYHQMMDEWTTRKVIETIVVLPQGIHSMNPHFEKNVETSNNVSVVGIHGEKVEVVLTTRYSSISKVEYIENQIELIARRWGGDYERTTRSPFWEYKSESPLRALCLMAYEKATGKKGVVNGLHAGLECCNFYLKNREFDLVSTGPDIFNIHSTNEQLSISSVGNVWHFLIELLALMK